MPEPAPPRGIALLPFMGFRALRRRVGPVHLLVALGLCVVVAAALLHFQQHRHFLFDDAHITFRFSQNLAQGKGLVYNEGERVEGTSAFLFAVLLAIPIALGAPALAAAQVLGAAGALGVLFYVFATVRLVFPERRGALLGLGAALAVAWSTPLAAYAMSGLETTLFLLLVVAALHHYVRASLGAGSPVAWPVLLGLASMTRPEGTGYFAVLLAFDLARQALRIGAARALARAARSVAWFSALFVPLLAFRLLYFGEIVPNTVVAKNTFQSRILAAPLKDAVAMLLASDGPPIIVDFVGKTFGPLALLAAPALFSKRARTPLLLFFSCSLLTALVCVWAEGDWMPHYRLLVPLLPLGFMAIALGLGASMELLRERGLGEALPSVAAGAALLLGAHRAHDERGGGKRSLDAAEQHLIDLGRKLAAVRAPDDVMVTDIAGIIPFYAGMRTVDMLGLCDRYIAHHGKDGGKMGKYAPGYTIAVEPTFYVMNFRNGLDWLYQQPAFAPYKDAYWVVLTPYDRSPRNPWRDKKLVLVRKDRPNMEQFQRVFEAQLIDPRALVRAR